MKMRRRVSTFQHSRHASVIDGGSSASNAASSSAPAASRSNLPRTGSFNRKARNAKTTVGTAKTKNGTRQLK